jgi:hypothetical protein
MQCVVIIIPYLVMGVDTNLVDKCVYLRGLRQWRTQEFFSGGGGGFKQIQFRTEGRENVVMGAVANQSGVSLNLQMRETRILCGTGNSAQLCKHFGISVGG